ncbi:MAG: peptidylprolyl isomerase [Pseudomonadota bacterium]
MKVTDKPGRSIRQLGILALITLALLSACSEERQPAEEAPAEELTSTAEETKSAAELANEYVDTSATEQAADAEPTDTPIQDTTPMVTLKTNLGDIELELDAENAPLTVANFLAYAQDGHYNGTIFHRVIPGFMVQGGGFEPGMQQKPTKTPVQNEANNGLRNDTFTIAMARTPDPHSATAQFFINVNNNASLNFTSETPAGWGYAVFGKVTNGSEVVKTIEMVDTGRAGPHGDVPLEDIVIESVELN